MQRTTIRAAATLILVSVATLAALLGTPAPSSAAAATALPSSRGNPSLALYRGRMIDLRVSWEGADACASDGRITRCFDSEREMDAYLAGHDVRGNLLDGGAELTTEVDGDLASAIVAPIDDVGGSLMAALCGSTLRLWSDPGFAGSLLQLSTRYTIANLSAYGFSNIVSSYKVGACNSVFYDGSNGSGSTFPGGTWAGAQGSSMLAGWDNRISSVYIG